MLQSCLVRFSCWRSEVTWWWEVLSQAELLKDHVCMSGRLVLLNGSASSYSRRPHSFLWTINIRPNSRRMPWLSTYRPGFEPWWTLEAGRKLFFSNHNSRNQATNIYKLFSKNCEMRRRASWISISHQFSFRFCAARLVGHVCSTWAAHGQHWCFGHVSLRIYTSHDWLCAKLRCGSIFLARTTNLREMVWMYSRKTMDFGGC